MLLGHAAGDPLAAELCCGTPLLGQVRAAGHEHGAARAAGVAGGAARARARVARVEALGAALGAVARAGPGAVTRGRNRAGLTSE